MSVDPHKIVSRHERLAVRKAHLARESGLARRRDRLSAEWWELPWLKVETCYVNEGPNGKETLGNLFDSRGQLIIYHFKFDPDWDEDCGDCSFLADHVDAARLHLEHHDVSVVVVSRTPLPELAAFKQAAGWRFNWVPSHGSDFNYDYLDLTSEGRSESNRMHGVRLHDWFDEYADRRPARRQM
jgi:predicted dithiol-disulfide oxidoreductase (DUF899 family)